MRLFSRFSGIAIGALALVATAIFVGCGGSEGNGTFTVVGDGGPDTGTDPNAEGGTPADGGTDSSTIKSDGGDGGGDASDGAVKDNRIDPIEVGHAWTYNVTVLGFYPACTNGVFVSNALSSAPLDGKTAIDVQSFCQNAGVVKYSVDGDRVYSRIAGAWRISLDSPVTEGHTWTDGFLNYKWESKGTVTTAAGTFKDCWSATTVASYSSYILLCRGVGPVKWLYNDGFGNGYEATLTAKNF